MLGHVTAASLGERVRAPFPGGGLQHDQALVLQLRERRIHRPGARPPEAAAAIGDLLDDLVSVHRLLGEQRQRRGAYIAALCPATAPAVAACPRPEARRAAVETGASLKSGTEVGPETAAAAELCPLGAHGAHGAPGASGGRGHARHVASLIEARRTEPRPEPPASVIPMRLAGPDLVA